MKVLILGANGRTGSLVTNRAVDMGHEVSVLVRHPGLYNRSSVRIIEGNALKVQDVLNAMDHQHAVIQCIGGTAPWKKQTLEREAMGNIVSAMGKAGASRLLVVSAMGVGESIRQSPWWYRFLMVPTFLRGSTADKYAMEASVRNSGMKWIIARPPVLTNGSAIGNVRVLGKNEIGHTITRADLAVWMVEQLTDDGYVGQAVVVVNS